MYVLFREVDHQEAYLRQVRLGDSTALRSRDPYVALTFETARQAYNFGEAHRLYFWRVRKWSNIAFNKHTR